MDATSIRSHDAGQEFARRIDWGGVWTWFFCFGLIAYLGLKGGGYDPLVHDQVGIAVWWVLIAGVLVGALPNHRPGTLALAGLGLLTAFVAWTALSLTWTESVEKTSADLARVATYLGVFVLALFARDREGARRVVAAVGAGIVFVAAIALLSRLHSAWFPAADQTAQFLTSNRERLSYPLHYWNGLAALIAIGLPLVLQIATRARATLWRAAAAAALPAMALTAFMTLSRGGIAAAFLALAVFVALTPDRLSIVPTLLLSGLGSLVLIVAADHRDALQHGLMNASADRQGDELLLIVLAVCAIVGLLQAAIVLAASNRERPAWARVPRRTTLVALAAGALIVLAVAGAAGAPGRASDAWAEFKEKGSPGTGTDRLGSVAGQNRYQLWSAAVKENASDPLTGTGSGTFEYWWARNADVPEIVRDTHSLYLQTLGELGIVGLVLLIGFLAAVVGGGCAVLLAAPLGERSALAAALAGCVAFCVTATFDWMWQLPVLPVALLMLSAVLLSGGRRVEWGTRKGLPLGLRIGTAATAFAAIVAIAIPLASTSLVRSSEADAREGDLSAALEEARTAQNVQPGAASPRLQQALVLEAQGEFSAASEAARAAAEREPTNWRIWLVSSRIEAEDGRPAAAVHAYGKARSLNPLSPIFDR
ncbi:MAG TPA: O-antigen ligase family protein [Solirubrobacterales bacterium]|nr:O-antigen ligase family protein [Solirubrobacterales bacterium]